MRGLRTKSHSFFNKILLNDFDVYCISETWLNDRFHSPEYFDDRYQVFRSDRNSSAVSADRGGGVAIAIRQSLNPIPRPEWSAHPSLDYLWVSIPIRHGTVTPTHMHSPKCLHICCVYIPHSNRHETELCMVFESISNLIQQFPNDIFLITGDFNVTYADWYFDLNSNSMVMHSNTNSLVQLTADFMSFTSLKQFNSSFNLNKRLLDLVFCNSTCNVLTCGSPLTAEDAHHKSLVINLNLEAYSPLSGNITYTKLFYKADYDAIRVEMSAIDWCSEFSTCNNIDSLVKTFYNIINTLIKKHIPTRKVINNARYPSWYTIPLIKLSREKKKYHAKWKRYGNPLDYQVFSTLRKRESRLQNIVYHNFIQMSEDNIKKCPKLFWRYVKSKLPSNHVPQTVTFNQRVSSNGEDTCNLFNEYFNSVFVRSVPRPASYDLNCPPLNSPVSLSNLTITAEAIYKELKSIDTNKGAGHDGIHPLFIRSCAKQLSTPLCFIYQKSLELGIFPSAWKLALITPIPKNDNINDVSQYRPISKTNLFGKVFEKIITTKLTCVLKNHINVNQHGFCKGRSVETNMLTFTSFLVDALDRKKQVDVVYSDFSKAFDKINHDLLIEKLWTIGIHGDLLRWLDSYVKNRSQAVAVKGFVSRFLDIPSGIPQGSHIGPLLFIIYINDIEKIVQNSNFLLYADDAKFFRIVEGYDDCLRLQSDIERLTEYCSSNQLFLNLDKCSVISYTRKTNPINFDYTINNSSLARVTSIRDLGILMDSGLSFNLHIDNIVNKAFRQLGFILRVSKPFKQSHTLKLLYFSFVRSILDFACIIWSPFYACHIGRIERVQKKFIKNLDFRENHDHVTYEDSLRRHSVTTLENRRIMFDQIFLFKILNNFIDSPHILEKNCIRVPRSSSRSQKLFVIPAYKSVYTSNNFFRRSVDVYCKMFDHIDIFCNSLTVYRRLLHTRMSTTLL